MKPLVDAPTLPRPTVSNPERPKTLTEGRERIEVLEAQLLQLRGSATAPKPALTVPAPTAKPKLGSGADAPPVYPPTGTPGGNEPNENEMKVGVPAPKKMLLDPSLDTPFKITTRISFGL